jgi:predicted PurR-regulated permease PerM
MTCTPGGRSGSSEVDERKFRLVFVILLAVAVSVIFVAMIRGFLMTILLAAIFSGLIQPLYQRFLRLFGGHKNVASALTLIVIFIAVGGPLLAFLGILASQAVQVVQAAGPWIEGQIDKPDNLERLMERFPALERLEPYQEEITSALGKAVGAVGNFLASGLSATTKKTVTFLFHSFLLFFTMFFFLKDGGRILSKILSYVPLMDLDKQRIVDKFEEVTRATLMGTLVIGIIQGGLAGIAFAVAGIQGAVFWGTVMTFLSIIPGVGAPFVWIPAVVYLLTAGQIATGVALGLFCALVVGTVDNFLRPRLVGRRARMHELLILFGTLGGIILFGVAGFIIGPIVAALFVTVWEIYGTVLHETMGRWGNGKEGEV